MCLADVTVNTTYSFLLRMPDFVKTSWASYQIRKTVGAHAPGMPGTFSPQARVSDPDMDHGTIGNNCDYYYGN